MFLVIVPPETPPVPFDRDLPLLADALRHLDAGFAHLPPFVPPLDADAARAALLGVPFRSVPVDPRGRMDANALDALLAAGDIGTVVATLGTTAAGAVDPLPDVLDACRRRGARVHVDAAYGGYFTLAGNLGASAR